MICTNCGFSTADEAVYCPRCGVRLPDPGTTTEAVRYPSGYNYIDRASPPVPDAELASFGQRLVAYLLDSIISGILGVLVGISLALLLVVIVIATQNDAAGQLAEQQRDDDRAAALQVGWTIGSTISGLVYYWIGTAVGATLGKRALGIRVVRERDLAAPGFGTALLRVVISWFSAIVLLLGYLWALWDGKKQTWHDHAAGTIVVLR